MFLLPLQTLLNYKPQKIITAAILNKEAEIKRSVRGEKYECGHKGYAMIAP